MTVQGRAVGITWGHKALGRARSKVNMFGLNFPFFSVELVTTYSSHMMPRLLHFLVPQPSFLPQKLEGTLIIVYLDAKSKVQVR